jgi:hypothetical protein
MARPVIRAGSCCGLALPRERDEDDVVDAEDDLERVSVSATPSVRAGNQSMRAVPSG